MLAFLYDILIALLACPEYGWDGAVDVCVHQNPELLEKEE
jgi:hypothetical protein